METSRANLLVVPCAQGERDLLARAHEKVDVDPTNSPRVRRPEAVGGTTSSLAICKLLRRCTSPFLLTILTTHSTTATNACNPYWHPAPQCPSMSSEATNLSSSPSKKQRPGAQQRRRLACGAVPRCQVAGRLPHLTAYDDAWADRARRASRRGINQLRTGRCSSPARPSNPAEPVAALLPPSPMRIHRESSHQRPD